VHKNLRTPLVLLAAGGLVLGGVGVSSIAVAAPDGGHRTPAKATAPSTVHDLPDPKEDKRRALREEAISQVLRGQAEVENRNGSKVVRLSGGVAPKRVSKGRAAAAAPQAKDQYVELQRERTDKIFVVLAEFGNERHPSYPDQDTDPNTAGPTTFDGPLHNAIPAPDRSVDNSTVWQADYSPDHYRQLYFGSGAGVQSLKTYYQKQSSGRYSVAGEVTDWVKVRYNEARYGRSNGYPCSGNICSNSYQLIRDAVDQWVANRKAAGATDASIKAELSSFDSWDRYDYDGDGNFNEPDGYIDHFQIVHAGGDQADGDPYQGEDAIWSHRSKAFAGTGQGPAGNPDGGTQIGNTGLWVADYTMQPENGGLSVFAHEYGHDLGLRDLYDTAASGDNPVNWWSLMAQSRVSAKKDVGIGTRPQDLGAWDKMQLGWLAYEVVPQGVRRTLNLGPHEYNSSSAQAVVTPIAQRPVVTDYPDPPQGAKTWWSGSGDDYSATMSRSLTLPAGTTTLTFQTAYNIEDCEADPCDYAFVEVKVGGAWVALPGSITDPEEGNGIDGLSNGWVPATFDLSAYAGQTVQLRVRYETDGAAQGQDPAAPSGIFVDDLAVTSNGSVIFSDGAESGANGWELQGFRAVGTSVTTMYDRFYIASNREYVSYDKYLKTGPYNLGFPDRPDVVEHFPYQDGLLVSLWDTSQTNNNTSQHPGEGQILPIDSHPDVIYRLDGKPWRGRIQTYDAPFSLQKGDSFTLHAQETGQASYIRGQAAQPLFDDTRNYWRDALPRVGVKTPGVGVTMKVVRENETSVRVQVGVTTPRPDAAAAARTVRAAEAANAAADVRTR